MSLRAPLFLLFALSSLLVLPARADESSYGKILKERDAVLSQLVAAQEGRFKTGTVSEEDLFAARLALWSFRRDTAASPAGKIAQQELIVGLYEKRLAWQQGLFNTGLNGKEAVLLATDALLQARQTREELKLGLKKN